MGKSALAVKEKKSTEEPSTGERFIHLWLSLIALSPASPGVYLPNAWLQIVYLQIALSNCMQSRKSRLNHETH